MWRGVLDTTHLIVCVMLLQSFPDKENVSVVSSGEKELAKDQIFLLLRERQTHKAL